MLTETNMSLEDIRNMDYFDFQSHVLLLISKENAKQGSRQNKKKKISPKELLQKKALQKFYPNLDNER